MRSFFSTQTSARALASLPVPPHGLPLANRGDACDPRPRCQPQKEKGAPPRLDVTSPVTSVCKKEFGSACSCSKAEPVTGTCRWKWQSRLPSQAASLNLSLFLSILHLDLFRWISLTHSHSLACSLALPLPPSLSAAREIQVSLDEALVLALVQVQPTSCWPAASLKTDRLDSDASRPSRPGRGGSSVLQASSRGPARSRSEAFAGSGRSPRRSPPSRLRVDASVAHRAQPR